MANLCSLTMVIKGKKEGVMAFYNALTQKGDTWMGRGANVNIIDKKITDDGNTRIKCSGWTKWSMDSSLIDDAISMRENPEKWADIDDVKQFLTLWEACEKYGVEFEAYSEESDEQFQEHFAYINGERTEERVHWKEQDLDEYNTKEDAEKDLEISITDEQWKEHRYESDGFGNWDFQI